MILKLIVASSLSLAADLPPLSLKDTPAAPRSAVSSPLEMPLERKPVTKLPGPMLVPDARPFLRVEGYPGRLTVSLEELSRWGLRSGDSIGVGLATMILQDREAKERPASRQDD